MSEAAAYHAALIERLREQVAVPEAVLDAFDGEHDQPASGPVATGRDGSATHSDHDPG